MLSIRSTTLLRTESSSCIYEPELEGRPAHTSYYNFPYKQEKLSRYEICLLNCIYQMFARYALSLRRGRLSPSNHLCIIGLTYKMLSRSLTKCIAESRIRMRKSGKCPIQYQTTSFDKKQCDTATMTTHKHNQTATSVNVDKESLPPFRGSSKGRRTMGYHIYSLWLFTFSDIKTIIVPKTLFGIITLLSGRNLIQDPRPKYTTILRCIPFIIAWNWVNLLPLDMSNQQDVKSTIEDKLNKPWRPIPAGRLTIHETRVLMFISYAVAVFASLYLGAMAECVALIFEGWIYNMLEGANKSFLARNILNAAGYMTFASGAARVACIHSRTQLREDSSLWFAVLGGVISTTIQFQDLYDQAGDALRGRRTIPLVVGDKAARLTIGIPIAIWSCACPAFWKLGLHGFVMPIVLGAVIMFRLSCYRSVDGDKKSFMIWNAWLMSLYLLPSPRTII